jgi:hypothetical protein
MSGNGAEVSVGLPASTPTRSGDLRQKFKRAGVASLGAFTTARGRNDCFTRNSIAGVAGLEAPIPPPRHREEADDDALSFFRGVAFHDFSVQGVSSRVGNPTAPNGTVFNDPVHAIDDRSYVNCMRTNSRTFWMSPHRDYDRQDFKGGYPTDSAHERRAVRRCPGRRMVGRGVQLTKRLWERHVDFGRNIATIFGRTRRIDTSTGLSTGPDSGDRQNHGIYVQGDFAILTNLHFNAGVRYDQSATLIRRNLDLP